MTDSRCRTCGCTASTPCADGCFWAEADLCSRCKYPGLTGDPELLLVPFTVELSLGLALILHGFLCLALRHPEIQGRTATALVDAFVEELGQLLVDAGVLTGEVLKDARQGERAARPRIVRGR